MQMLGEKKKSFVTKKRNHTSLLELGRFTKHIARTIIGKLDDFAFHKIKERYGDCRDMTKRF